MTAPTIAVLVESKYCEAAQTTQYTATGKVLIDIATFTNVTASTVNFTLNIVPSGDSASSGNRVVSSQDVLPGQCYIADEACHNLEAGDFISTFCSAGSSLVMRVSGREIT